MSMVIPVQITEIEEKIRVAVQKGKGQECRMRLEITDGEKQLLLELVEEEQKRTIQGLDHTDSRDYKAVLKERLSILEVLLRKVQGRAA
jgi:hypothetical protein